MKLSYPSVVALWLCSMGLYAQSTGSLLQKFSYWDKLREPEKITFFLGFTNGLGASRATVVECENVTCAEMTPGRRKQIRCILLGTKLDAEQAIAMIDKYYKENPAKWNAPIGSALIEALTVRDSPCATSDK